MDISLSVFQLAVSEVSRGLHLHHHPNPLAFAMDRVQLLLVGLPLFLFFSDVVNLFSPPPRPTPPPPHHPRPVPRSVPTHTPDFPLESKQTLIGLGNTVTLSFCASCSYRGTAAAMKQMLETSFPGIEVILVNHPPTLPKRLLGKVVPVFQMGVIAIVMAGEQIFPRLGFVTPPAWYYSLRANRFGTIASAWLLGNVFQNFLQSSGAFEVYLNDELVFSKLKLQRFPNEVELKSILNNRLGHFGLVEGDVGGVWS